MKRMSLHKFGRMVARVMETLPEEFYPHLDNLVVDVEEEADVEALRHMGYTDEEIDAGEHPYGYFVPLGPLDTEALDLADVPNRLIIYKRPLEEDFPDPKQLRIEIRKTVVHELAHHFGWTDRDLEEFDETDDPFGD